MSFTLINHLSRNMEHQQSDMVFKEGPCLKPLKYSKFDESLIRFDEYIWAYDNYWWCMRITSSGKVNEISNTLKRVSKKWHINILRAPFLARGLKLYGIVKIYLNLSSFQLFKMRWKPILIIYGIITCSVSFLLIMSLFQILDSQQSKSDLMVS